MSQTDTTDLSFQAFLESVDGTQNPEAYKALSDLGEQFGLVPKKDKDGLLCIAQIYNLAIVVRMLRHYEPRVDVFTNLWSSDPSYYKDESSILEEAARLGITPANPKWFDREQINPERKPIILAEGIPRERFFDMVKTTYPQQGYKIPTNMDIFFSGLSIYLGVRSEQPIPSGVWTQSHHNIKLLNGHISDYVPVTPESAAVVFNRGIIRALRAREIADLIGRFNHGFAHTLETCVEITLRTGRASYLSSCLDEAGKYIDVSEDLRIQTILSGMPPGLEHALRRLKENGHFFDPYEIKSEFSSMGIAMPDGIASLVEGEERNYGNAAQGIETTQAAVQQAIRCMGWGHTMLEFFYMLVSDKDTKALVHHDGYFLVGRNGDTEIVLSYTRNSAIANQNRRSHSNKGGFLEHYVPDGIGALSFETDSARYFGARDSLLLIPDNAFCIATPVGRFGEGGDFAICKDNRYAVLFKAMSEHVSDSMSWAHTMHEPTV